MPKEPSQNRLGSSNRDIGDSLAIGVVFALVLTVTQRGIGFVRGIALCRTMPDEQVGLWSLSFSFLMLLAPLAVFGLPGTFGRFVEHYRLKGQLSVFLKRIISVCLLSTVVLSCGLCVGADSLSEILFGSPGYSSLVVALGLSLLAVVVVNLVAATLEALRQVRLVTVIRFFSGVLFSILSLAAVVVVSPSAVMVTYCFGIASLAGLIPAIWYFRHIKKNPLESTCSLGPPTIWKRIVPFAAWMWFVNFASNCFELADRYMLLRLTPGETVIGQSMVGQYHSSRVVPLLFVSVATMLAGVLMPYLAAAWEQNRKDEIESQMNLTVKLTSFGFTIFGSLVLIFAPFLFDVVLLGRYSEGLSVLPFTMVYCLWYAIFLVAENYLWLLKKGKLAFVAIAIGLLANVGLNYWLIPLWGLQGAVVATGVANVVCLVTLSVFNNASGWHLDYRIVFAMLLPAVLMAPVPIIIAFMIALLLATYKTEILINASERETLNSLMIRLKAKLGVGNIAEKTQTVSTPS